jgi:hypothetical protein
MCQHLKHKHASLAFQQVPVFFGWCRAPSSAPLLSPLPCISAARGQRVQFRPNSSSNVFLQSSCWREERLRGRAAVDQETQSMRSTRVVPLLCCICAAQALSLAVPSLQRAATQPITSVQALYNQLQLVDTTEPDAMQTLRETLEHVDASDFMQHQAWRQAMMPMRATVAESPDAFSVSVLVLPTNSDLPWHRHHKSSSVIGKTLFGAVTYDAVELTTQGKSAMTKHVHTSTQLTMMLAVYKLATSH